VKRMSLSLLIYLLVLLIPPTSQAATCYAKPGTNAACFTVKSHDSNRGEPLPAYIENCEQKTIISSCDNAQICYTDAQGKIHCSSCDKGQCLTQLDEAPSAYSFSQLLAMIYTPSPSSSLGLKRLSDAETLPGFPEGEIAVISESLQFPLARKYQKKLTTFEISTATGQAIYSAENIDGLVNLPTDRLDPGKLYEWKATIGKKRYRGKFKTLPQADQRDFLQDLADLQQGSSNDAYARALQEAAVALDWGLAFNKQQAIEKARQLQQGEK